MCKITYNSSNIIGFIPNLICYSHLDPQYVYQISVRLKHAYASYSDLRKVCEKKKEKTKKFLQNFADSYLWNGLRDLIKIWNLASPEWKLTLQ